MGNIKLFQDKKIRTHYSEEEEKWYFSIIDVVQVLSESNNARRYWSDLKRKLTKEGFDQLYEIIVQLKLESPDGRKYKDFANTQYPPHSSKIPPTALQIHLYVYPELRLIS